MEKRFFFLDAHYEIGEAGDLGLAILGREGKNKIRLVDRSFLPYIYAVVEGDLEKISRNIKSLKGVKEVEVVELTDVNVRKKVLKITVPSPRDVPDFRSMVREVKGVLETREDDIPFVRRYCIDHNLQPFGEAIATINEKNEIVSIKPGEKDYNPKILAFDIEAYATDGFALAKESPVIMISLAGCGTKKVLSWQGPGPAFAEVLPDEKAMFVRFIELVDELDPDILIGYNSDNFDIPYLKERAKKLGVKFTLAGEPVSFVKRGISSAPSSRSLILLDVFSFVKNIASKNMKAESLDLDTVANELIGVGKEPMTWEELIMAWQSGNLKPLYDYSLQDSVITLALAEKLFPVLFQLSKLLRVSVFDVSRMTTGQIVEWFLISRARQSKLLVPNRPHREEKESRISQTFTGAFVKEPKKGLHQNIAVADFRSLYPTIIVSHNVGPDTLNCRCHKENVSPSGDWFCKTYPAFLPSVLKDVLVKRFELKDEMKKADKKSEQWTILNAKQQALKLIANSFYGYLGFFGARWYCLECARAVTAWGRDYIKKTMTTAEEQGFEVLYGDTDSLFLSKISNSFQQELQQFINQVNEKLPEMMELELEGIYKRGIFLTKKRYAMVDLQGNVVVKGLERVRRDWAPIARETQEAVLKALLDEGNKEKAVQAVQNAINRLRKKEASVDEVVVYTQLTRDPEKYEQIGPQVKAAIRLRKLGKVVRMGTVVRYIIIPGTGSISDRARPVEESQNYDPDYYIEHHVVPACQRILDALDLHVESKGQSKLGKFF